jgi:hypothetical protein
MALESKSSANRCGPSICRKAWVLPDFLTDIFCGLLGYTGPAEMTDIFTFSRERHVEVGGKFADAVPSRFQKEKEQPATASAVSRPRIGIPQSPHGCFKAISSRARIPMAGV